MIHLCVWLRTICFVQFRSPSTSTLAISCSKPKACVFLPTILLSLSLLRIRSLFVYLFMNSFHFWVLLLLLVICSNIFFQKKIFFWFFCWFVAELSDFGSILLYFTSFNFILFNSSWANWNLIYLLIFIWF